MTYPKLEDITRARYYLCHEDTYIDEIDSENDLICRVVPEGTIAIRLEDGSPMYVFDGGGWVFIGPIEHNHNQSRSFEPC